jgi:ubiquinone/menaquinone biosynthesis C-methylase UbiE
MQRGALVPVARWASEPRRRAQSSLKVLEVACGTGRFATFVREAHPLADVTLTDLSPFYLEAARENQVRCSTSRCNGVGRRF